MAIQNPTVINGFHLNDLGRLDLLLFGDGSVRIAKEIPEITEAVRKTHPGGVNLVIIGTSNRTGWKPLALAGSNGSYAILIGLLLPAIQKVREAANRAKMLDVLKIAVAPGGKTFILDAVGRLVPAG